MTYKIRLNYRDDTSEIIDNYDVDSYDLKLFYELKEYAWKKYHRNDLRSYELIQEVKR